MVFLAKREGVGERVWQERCSTCAGWASRDREEVSRLRMGTLCRMGNSWEFFTSLL